METDIKKIIFRSLIAHPLRSTATLITILGSVVLEVLPPLLLGRAVDALTGQKEISFFLAVGYFVLLGCSGIFSALREAMIVGTGEGITHSLRSAMMEKLRRLPAAYFTRHEAGETASIQVNDVDAIEDMFSSGLISMISDLGTVLSILAVVLTKSPGLGILLLVALPLLSLFTLFVQKKMLAAHLQNRKATADASGILPETLHCIRSLHIYDAMVFAERRYDGVILNSFKALERTNFYDSIYSPVIITTSAAVIGIMMSLSGAQGIFLNWFDISVGTAVALISYVNSIFTPLSNIGMEIQTVQSAAAGWKRVQYFLREQERILPENRVVKVVNDSTKAVEIQNVSFSYTKGHPILQHFSLTVQQGECVTLMGRTGSGKSTLFKLLLGLYSPQEGRILLNGIAPTAYFGAARRRIISCVQQQVIAVPGTIRDQVTLGNQEYSDAAIWDALAMANLKDTVMRLPKQLDTVYRDAIFSQGQKQLLMIARAVVSDPAILLLDEITAGLDTATEKMVIEALLRAAASRTVLSISHRMSEVLPGKIVEI